MISTSQSSAVVGALCALLVTSVPAAAQFVVGAAKNSLEPRPADYGGVWLRDADACSTLSEAFFSELQKSQPGPLAHLASAGSPWPENPNCLYMGGFGIGPMNPITDWDQELGLWVRSIAIGDGSETIVLTILDAEGYFWDYASKCDDCGAKQLSESLAAEHAAMGLRPSGVVIASTHAHSSPDLIGGWGFVPDWYMAQVKDTIELTVREAVASMRSATIEVGEQRARQHNRERRDTYRSAEEQQVTWLRALDAGDGSVIATVGAYAAHPTTKGTNGGMAHADWPGRFEHRVEERFGGIGLLFMTGLGNISTRGGEMMGVSLADLIPAVGKGSVLTEPEVRSARHVWVQPATNVPLTALGYPGFFDRQFNASPAQLQTGKSPDTAPCLSASGFSVEVSVTAGRIGKQFAFSTAPGEIFSNFSNTLKERTTDSGVLVTMPIGQANDALGYMPQQFEMNEVGQQGLGFAVGGAIFVNYEDSYAIDRCFGDMALESTLGLFGGLN